MLTHKQQKQRARLRNIVLCVVAVIVALGLFYGLALRPGMQETARLDAMAGEVRSGGVTPTAAPTGKAAPEPLAVERGGEPLRVLFTGDSLTGGYFATTKDATFTALLSSEWGDVEVTSAARAGQALSTVSSIVDVPSDLDIAVVELGTNDVSTSIATPLGDFRDQYGALLSKITDTSPDAAIVCAGTWTEAGGQYDQVIRDECEATGGVYVSLYSGFADPDNHGPAGVETPLGVSDEFHPNDAGHSWIADQIAARIAIH